MDFSPQQEAALRQVDAWLESGDEQVFRLFGYAGTGKTTLARHLAQNVEGDVYFGAFTGKAAYVLRQKGCPNATTIHKLIYLPRDKSRARLETLKKELEEMPEGDPRRAKLQESIRLEEKNLGRPMFSLNLESPLRHARLLVVDEVSMVDEQMGRDLESFGCKILVLGDPAQLPPVRGAGYFINDEPDICLTEIHRQARDNPIIHMATLLREERRIEPGAYGESRVQARMDPDMALKCDQMIVGKNDTRYSFNKRVRQLLGRRSPLPEVNDKLVCLRNNHEVGLLNGAIWHVTEVDREMTSTMKDRMRAFLSPEGGEPRNGCLGVDMHTHYFTGGEPQWWEKQEAEEFDYGYALTCHKSQGSQWNHVLVYDESSVFRASRWRWLYTAVTRAAERVDLINHN